MNYLNRIFMRRTRISPGLLAIFLAACVPAAAQLGPTEPDPLARIRDAAKTNVQACSATGETLCEQVAPKIIENALGESPLAENLRRLTESVRDQKTGLPKRRLRLPGRSRHFETRASKFTLRNTALPVAGARGRVAPTGKRGRGNSRARKAG